MPGDRNIDVIKDASFDDQVDQRIAVLVTCEQPLTEIGLEFAVRRATLMPPSDIS